MTQREIELQEQILVPRQIADCYRYLAEFAHIEQWDPSVRRARKLSDGAPAVGSRYELTLAFLGQQKSMDYRITGLEPQRLIELQGEGEGFSAVDRIRFTAVDDATTQIDYAAQIRIDGLSALSYAVFGRLMQRAGRAAVAGIRKALSVDLKPSSLGPAATAADVLVVPGMWKFTRSGYQGMPNKGLSEFMDGRRVVVTGPTGGLGLETARMLSRLGADLVLLGRDAERLAAAADDICAFSGRERSSVAVFEADLLSIEQTRAAAARIARDFPRIDVLINNAGALFNERGETADGHERSLAINLIAPWVLTEALMPALKAARGRVVNVASGGMYTQALKLDDLQYSDEAYNGPKAYARAKRGLVAISEYWAAAEPDIGFHAMHPGWAATPGVSKSLPEFERKLQGHLRDARMGADTIVWLASTAAVTGHSGKFWFDRQAHDTALLPLTRHTPQQTESLVAWLREVGSRQP